MLASFQVSRISDKRELRSEEKEALRILSPLTLQL